MEKAIYFDLDGTLADLYNFKNWLPLLRASKTEPFIKAKPMYNMTELSNILQKLQSQNWSIGVISWLPMNATKKYEDRVRYAKKVWIKKYLNIKLDEIHFTKYGKDKFKYAKVKPSFLIDDDKKNVHDWIAKGGKAIFPDTNLFNFLQKMEV